MIHPSPEKSRPLLTTPMWAVLILAVAGAATWISMAAGQPSHDSPIFMWMGGRMLHGEVPYRNLWDNKLPPLYWINELAASTGHTLIALTVLGALGVAAGGWMLMGIARRCWGETAGGLAGLFYAGVAAAPYPLYGGNLTETWAAPMVIGCIWAMFRFADTGRRSNLWPLLSGVCMGLAASLRPPALLVGAPLLALLPSLRRRGRLRLWPAIVWVTGFALPIFVQLLWAEAHNVVSRMVEYCILFNFSYGTSAQRPEWVTWRRVAYEYGRLVQRTWWWHATALSGLIVLALNWKRQDQPRQADTENFPAVGRWVLIWWLVSAAVSALPSLRLYPHHYYLTWAPLALATAPLWQALPGAGVGLWQKQRRYLGWALIAVLTVFLLVHFNRAFENQANNRGSAQGLRDAADYIRDKSKPTDTVFIFAWGWETDMLWRMDRPCNTRHPMVMFYPELHVRDQLLGQWQKEMLTNPPDWIVCLRGIELPGGDLSRLDFHGWAEPAMRAYLMPVHEAYGELYHVDKRFANGGLLIYRHKRSTTAPDDQAG